MTNVTTEKTCVLPSDFMLCYLFQGAYSSIIQIKMALFCHPPTHKLCDKFQLRWDLQRVTKPSFFPVAEMSEHLTTLFNENLWWSKTNKPEKENPTFFQKVCSLHPINSSSFFGFAQVKHWIHTMWDNLAIFKEGLEKEDVFSSQEIYIFSGARSCLCSSFWFPSSSQQLDVGV